MADEYKLPKAIEERYKELYHELQVNKDAVKKMREAGLDTTSLELQIQEIEGKINKIVKAFKIQV